MPKVISLQNHKGGVGKTTISYLLGTLLSRHGKKTLLVDTDPQSNLTRSVGLVPENLGTTILDAWVGKTPAAQALANVGENLFILPSNFNLAFLEQNFGPYVLSKEIQLKKALDPILDDFDVVIVDTPPNFGLTVSSVLAFANLIIVPVNPHPFALSGFDQFFKIFEAARLELNSQLPPPKILLNMTERTNMTKVVFEMIDQDFPGARLITQLRRTVRLAEVTVSDLTLSAEIQDDLLALAAELHLL